MIDNATLSAIINSPVRTLIGKVELYNGSTLAATYTYTDALKSYSIERVGEAKFFGYGICQKLNVKLIDVAREITITTANSFKIYMNDVCIAPIFYVTEVHRDENTNELSITAYDKIYFTAQHDLSKLNLAESYTLEEVYEAISLYFGGGALINVGEDEEWKSLTYENGANFNGDETVQYVLNAFAEATQTVYYLDTNNHIAFKRPDIGGAALLDITKAKYFTLTNSDSRRLGTICHATELGDNVSVSITESGSTQYVRDNPFWDLRDDIDTILNEAIELIGGLTINQFECDWRGNPLLEIGDKISLTTKDNKTVNSFLLNDTLTYDGTLSQKTQWKYEDNTEETADNPVSLGAVLNQTTARVDKVNKTIELVAAESEENSENITSIIQNTNSISASVESIQKNVSDVQDDINNSIAELSNKVNAQITPEQVEIMISEATSTGANKVETNTGFTFNDEGLRVSKSNSEISTTITEDGMTVYKGEAAVLVANNTGVDATNLHATTYLIIGTNSRFEDYGDNRTGCFYIRSN